LAISIEVFCDKRVSMKTMASAEPIYEKRQPTCPEKGFNFELCSAILWEKDKAR